MRWAAGDSGVSARMNAPMRVRRQAFADLDALQPAGGDAGLQILQRDQAEQIAVGDQRQRRGVRCAMHRA